MPFSQSSIDHYLAQAKEADAQALHSSTPTLKHASERVAQSYRDMAGQAMFVQERDESNAAESSATNSP
jgi:hypothetical protein